MKLRERLQDARTLLLDGAMGTELQKYEPEASDYPDGKTGFNDGLCITHPEWVQSVHRSYLEAGADCITTNTFGSNVMKLDEYGLGTDTERINEDAARLAREVADSFAKPERYVVGSMGPTGYLPSITHKPEEEISLDVVEDAFYRQAVGLVRGGVDGLVLETSVDLLELRTAIRAARRADGNIPIMANITLAQAGRMLLGTPIEAAYTSISGMGIDVFGINCSTGPLEMEDGIRWLDGSATHPILVVPNAGIPDISEVDGGEYPLQAAEMSEIFTDMLRKYRGVRIVGGCCGTTPAHIATLRAMIDSAMPRVRSAAYGLPYTYWTRMRCPRVHEVRWCARLSRRIHTTVNGSIGYSTTTLVTYAAGSLVFYLVVAALGTLDIRHVTDGERYSICPAVGDRVHTRAD